MDTSRLQPESSDSLSAGYAALADARWADALACFQSAVEASQSAEAYDGLAMAGWWLDDVPVVFDSRERAYRRYRQEGNRLGAARAAIWIGLDHYIYRGELAIADGWLQRAERLLYELEPTAEHGWLAIWSGHIALFERHDIAAALAASAETLGLARTLGEADLEALALALEGLALVSAGQVAGGMRRLDESTTAAVSGDVSDYDAIATICCYLIFACERVRDYDRAAQWSAKVEAISLGCDYRSMFPVCRTHYAAVLIWRGEWQAAERELLEASRRLNASRRGWAPDSVVRLAELRRRQGRLVDAAALFEEAQGDVRSSLGQAEMALDRGDVEAAADLVDRFLRRVPADDRTERAQALELALRVEIRRGALDRAGALLDEIEATAALVGTGPLAALVALSRGRLAVAAGNADLARRSLEDAVDLFQQGGAPFETALARLDLACVLRDAGRRQSATTEARAALDTFQRIGAAPAAGRARDLLRSLDADSAIAAHDAADLTRRERDVLRLLAGGASNQQIADALFISIRTVERHISTIYDKLNATGGSARAVATAYAISHGLVDSIRHR